MDAERSVRTVVLLLLAVTYTHQAWVVPSPQPNLALYKEVHCESEPCDQTLVDGRFNRLPHRINSDISYSWIDLGKNYRISQIHLYDEILFDRLEIMTSTQVSPGRPTRGVAPGWTNQSVSPAFFPSLRQRHSISWSPSVLARHVALFSYTSAMKEIEIHTVVPQYNLAMGKPASQSNTNGEKVAQRAVNGNWTDFTQTQPGDDSWLTVDLLRNYKIGLIRVVPNPSTDNFTVMYSVVDSPSSPSLSSGIWTILRNRTKKSALIVDVFCFVTARHVAVFVEEASTGLAIIEMLVYVPYNLAYGRPAIQGPNSNLVANMAVNSIYSDFTSVGVDGVIRWWRVNLGDKYSLSKVELFRKANSSESLVNITLFTSNVLTPKNLTDGYEGWTNRSYQGPSYGAVGVTDFTSPIEAQYVAVVSENITAPFSLAEVVVYEYNYAKSKRVFCKPNCSPTQSNSLAVDGNLDTYSSFTRNQEWSYFLIDVGKKIVFTSLMLSVNGRYCSSAGNVGRCGQLTFILAVYTRPQQLTRDWNVFRDGALCMPLTTMVSNNIIVKCERFYHNPVARSVSVVFEQYEEAIREVEIYGKEVPRLAKDTMDWQVDIRNWSSLHISFRQWSQEDIGAYPPSGYNITLEDRSENITIYFHELTAGERVVCSWYNLTPITNYTISVGVLVNSVRHTPLLMFTETTACSDPMPQFTTVDHRSFAADGWLYPALNVTLTTTANCLGGLYHDVSVFDSNDQLIYRIINTPLNELFVEKLGNKETYKFILTANNSVQLTKTIEQTVTLKSLAYQDRTRCRRVLVNNSEYSDANETRALLGHRIYYQCNPGYKFVGDNYLTCWQHQVHGFVMRGSVVCAESNVTCPPPPPGGATEDVQRPSTRRKHNERYTYTCREGHFTLEGVTITCTGAGNWSSAPPNCIERTCEAPPAGTNTEDVVLPSGLLRFGEEYTYSCLPGYSTNDTLTITCIERYYVTPPICKVVECPTPPSGTDTQAVILPPEPLKYTQQYTYSCLTGYNTSDVLTVTCTADRTWSAQPPTCTVVTCPNLLAGTNTEDIIAPSRLMEYNDEYTYSCITGYNTSDILTVNCTKHANWSSPPPTCNVIQCPSPQDGVNAISVDPSTNREYLQQYTYTCVNGYKIKGNVTFTVRCEENGEWSAPPPTCQVVKCPTPPEGTNTEAVIPPSVPKRYNEQYTYSCLTGYRTSDELTVTCTSGGTWLPSPPTCTVVTCPSPSEGIKTVAVEASSSWEYQQTYTYACLEGYKPYNGLTITCQADGSWSRSTTVCIAVRCPTPPEGIQTVAVVSSRTWEYSQSYAYTCLEGYKPLKGITITCQSNGVWHPSVSACTEIIRYCTIPTIPNARQTSHTAKVKVASGQNVKYECTEGYKHTGKDTSLTCFHQVQGDARWKGTILCTDISFVDKIARNPVTTSVVTVAIILVIGALPVVLVCYKQRRRNRSRISGSVWNTVEVDKPKNGDVRLERIRKNSILLEELKHKTTELENLNKKIAKYEQLKKDGLEKMREPFSELVQEMNLELDQLKKKSIAREPNREKNPFLAELSKKNAELQRLSIKFDELGRKSAELKQKTKKSNDFELLDTKATVHEALRKKSHELERLKKKSRELQ